MGLRSLSKAGLTLAELLISIGLLSVVALGASTVYISGSRNLISSQANIGLVGAYTALDHIARKAALANLVQATTSTQLNLRWDYIRVNATTSGTPNLTGGQPIGTSPATDDTWVKYGVVLDNGVYKLYWRINAQGAAPNTSPPGAAIGAGDAEVQPGLKLDNAQTAFTQLNPTTVRIQLGALVGSPVRTVLLQRDVTAHAATN